MSLKPIFVCDLVILLGTHQFISALSVAKYASLQNFWAPCHSPKCQNNKKRVITNTTRNDLRNDNGHYANTNSFFNPNANCLTQADYSFLMDIIFAYHYAYTIFTLTQSIFTSHPIEVTRSSGHVME